MNATSKLCTFVLGIILCGCVREAQVITYPLLQEGSQLAVIRGLDNPLAANAHIATIDGLRPYVDRVVKVRPGKHVIGVMCDAIDGQNYSTPSVEGYFVAGNYYTITCTKVLAEERLLQVKLADRGPLKGQGCRVVDVPVAGKLWDAWAATHGDAACTEALGLLTGGDSCIGATCWYPLRLSDAYSSHCKSDLDGRIAMQRLRNQWRQQAGAMTSECISNVRFPPGKAEITLRDVVQRHPAQP